MSNLVTGESSKRRRKAEPVKAVGGEEKSVDDSNRNESRESKNKISVGENVVKTTKEIEPESLTQVDSSAADVFESDARLNQQRSTRDETGGDGKSVGNLNRIESQKSRHNKSTEETTIDELETVNRSTMLTSEKEPEKSKSKEEPAKTSEYKENEMQVDTSSANDVYKSDARLNQQQLTHSDTDGVERSISDLKQNESWGLINPKPKEEMKIDEPESVHRSEMLTCGKDSKTKSAESVEESAKSSEAKTKEVKLESGNDLVQNDAHLNQKSIDDERRAETGEQIGYEISSPFNSNQKISHAIETQAASSRESYLRDYNQKESWLKSDQGKKVDKKQETRKIRLDELISGIDIPLSWTKNVNFYLSAFAICTVVLISAFLLYQRPQKTSTLLKTSPIEGCQGECCNCFLSELDYLR